GPVQRALVAEAPPPLHAHGPRVPDEGSARVDPHEEHRRVGYVLPALDLHAKPVIHERIPQVLLALHEVVIRAIERPLAPPLGDPSRRARLLLAARVDLAPRLLGVTLGLPPPAGAAVAGPLRSPRACSL